MRLDFDEIVIDVARLAVATFTKRMQCLRIDFFLNRLPVLVQRKVFLNAE